MHRVLSQPYTVDSIKSLNQHIYTKNWPVVYLLENGKEMYVGETGNVQARFKQHYKREDRRLLTRSHVIIDEEYNKSATLDIESWLIQYMAADGQYTLQNGNGGLSDHDYFDREKYKAKFDVLWSTLQTMGLAQKDLFELKNTDIFKYSPYKSLTEEQLTIVHAIKDSLEQGEQSSHTIQGGPGTGKSVLASYLVKYLKQDENLADMKIGLVVPMTSLRKTFQRVFSKVKGLSASMVLGPNDVIGKQYDLLIVDEAHRLKRRVNLSGYGPFDKANNLLGLGKTGTQLDWILRSSKSQIFMYDKKQSVTPSDVRSSSFATLSAKKYHLTSQLRVMGGNDYIEYVENILTTVPIEKRSFGKYDLRYFDNIHELQNEIHVKDKEHGLARLVAGYAWNWQTKKDSSLDYDINLDGLKLKWNSTMTDWVNSKNAVNEVGCIHTIQGYDLNYVGVIIGPELSYDPVAKKLVVYKDKYLDTNGKRTLESPEELERYIINIYKTLLTRGIKGTYIHAVDKDLAIYIKEYFTYHNAKTENENEQ